MALGCESRGNAWSARTAIGSSRRAKTDVTMPGSGSWLKVPGKIFLGEHRKSLDGQCPGLVLEWQDTPKRKKEGEKSGRWAYQGGQGSSSPSLLLPHTTYSFYGCQAIVGRLPYLFFIIGRSNEKPPSFAWLIAFPRRRMKRQVDLGD